jgi:hypothetical protein
VTKLGNNMYFYTGPGGEDSPPPLQSDDEVPVSISKLNLLISKAVELLIIKA